MGKVLLSFVGKSRHSRQERPEDASEETGCWFIVMRCELGGTTDSHQEGASTHASCHLRWGGKLLSQEHETVLVAPAEVSLVFQTKLLAKTNPHNAPSFGEGRKKYLQNSSPPANTVGGINMTRPMCVGEGLVLGEGGRALLAPFFFAP